MFAQSKCSKVMIDLLVKVAGSGDGVPGRAPQRLAGFVGDLRMTLTPPLPLCAFLLVARSLFLLSSLHFNWKAAAFRYYSDLRQPLFIFFADPNKISFFCPKFIPKIACCWIYFFFDTKKRLFSAFRHQNGQIWTKYLWTNCKLREQVFTKWE